MTDCKGEEFIAGIKDYINYWQHQTDRNEKEKLEGLAFSILCMLDGVSGSFRGSSKNLNKLNYMLHENFYRKDND